MARAKKSEGPAVDAAATLTPEVAAEAALAGDAAAVTAKKPRRKAAVADAEPAVETTNAADTAVDIAPPKPKPRAKAKPKAEPKTESAVAAPAAVSEAAPAPSVPVAATTPAFPSTNYALVERLLVGFVAREVGKVGLSCAVLGLSGGVDSAVSAAIAARALGPANVLGVFMPYTSSSPESQDDAKAVADALGIQTLHVDISAQIDAYFDAFSDASRLRRGNKMARERMTILYDQSASRSALVIGTSNKTELLLGYGTLHGDMASALNPIGDLYKTQVWGLARPLGLPASVIEKAPTADLWAGQTDENELGFSYHEVDRLLYWMIDERCSRQELEAMGFASAFLERIAGMVRSSQFKRRVPLIAKISDRTVDPDFRYPRDWGL